MVPREMSRFRVYVHLARLIHYFGLSRIAFFFFLIRDDKSPVKVSRVDATHRLIN